MERWCAASRLPASRPPRARQRLAPTPLDLATPAWVDDDELRHPPPRAARARSRVDRPRGLIGFAGKAMAERLDHSRPLWCMDVVGPTDDGRTALVIRIHHCLADGVTALRMLSAAALGRRVGPAIPATSRPGRRGPTPGRSRLLAAGVGSRLRDLGGAVAGGARGRGLAARAGAGRAARSRALPAHASPRALAARGRHGVRPRIGGDRELAFTSASSRTSSAIEHAAGPSGDRQRRRPGDGRRGDPRAGSRPMTSRCEAMRVQVPVSMHHRDEDPATLGNRDSFLFCDLPVSEPDPRSAPRGDQRRNPQPQGAPRPGRALLLLPQPLAHPARCTGSPPSFASGPREFALSVSNVPGPTRAGAPARRRRRASSTRSPSRRTATRCARRRSRSPGGWGSASAPTRAPSRASRDLADGLDAVAGGALELC